MGQFIFLDYTGQRFGNLTAINFVRRVNNITYWLFKCDCGKEYVSAIANIKKRNGITCTCKKKPRKDLTGLKFGRLTAIKPLKQDKNGYWIWFCVCDCGKTKEVSSKQLINKLTTSCGCSRFKDNPYGKQPEYAIYCAIKARCNNKNTASYYSYGARGIKMCPEWAQDYSLFLKDMGKRPSKYHSIERIDMNGDYEPSNCKWATSKEQANNRRNNIKFTYKNIEYTLKQFSETFGLSYKKIHHYYKKFDNDINQLLYYLEQKGAIAS
jgi:hypothetical protein